MNTDEFALAREWDKRLRFITLALLLFGAAIFLISGVANEFFWQDEFTGGIQLSLAAAYFGMWVAYRKFGAPQWQYRLLVAGMVVPFVLVFLVR